MKKKQKYNFLLVLDFLDTLNTFFEDDFCNFSYHLESTKQSLCLFGPLMYLKG
jgi:hypothetical protein